MNRRTFLQTTAGAACAAATVSITTDRVAAVRQRFAALDNSSGEVRVSNRVDVGHTLGDVFDWDDFAFKLLLCPLQPSAFHNPSPL